jgi:filamentous hemagglutinin family protein
MLGMVGASLQSLPALALPQGGDVQSGQAQINQVSPNQLNIQQQTDRAVINWNSFSVAQPEQVNFIQPAATSATLNRVTGNTPSNIAGQINANGQVMLINPNGILFTPTAQINVGGLLATTLDISDQDFMQGRYQLNQVPGKPAKTVENQGTITVKDSGVAALVAPGVINRGVINARLGKVILASGTQATLDLVGDGLISLAVDPALAAQLTDAQGNSLNALVTQSGTINADGGTVTLSAKAGTAVLDSVINMSGVIQARTVANQNGKIVLSGGDTGVVKVSGQLDASGIDAGETGGTVQVLGEKVALIDNAKVDVSGDTGGGTALIGGDYKGQGTVPTAKSTFFGRNAVVNADAKNSGNGGKVIVWSDDATRFYGTITAKGGANSGNGGFVEVSGKQNLAFDGQVNLSASAGDNGQLLLDPATITIAATAPGADDAEVADGNIAAGDGGAANFTISSTALENALSFGNVTLAATNLITVNSDVNSPIGNDLALNAPTANLNALITMNGGTLSGTATTVNVGAGGNVQNGVDVAASGANVNLAAATYTGTGTQVVSINKSLNLNGAGQGSTILDGQNARRGVTVAGAGNTVNINNLTIQNGRADGRGGGIDNENSTLNLTSVTVTNNTAVNNAVEVDGSTSGGDGGGINNSFGTVTLTNSTVSNNTAEDDAGGISNFQGILTLNNSTVAGNSAANTATSSNDNPRAGGGIESRGPLSTVTLNNSTVSNNRAVFGGGIFTSEGTLNVSGSTISGNTTTGVDAPDPAPDILGDGGGLLIYRTTTTIRNSRIVNNTSSDDGGGLDIGNANVTIEDTTIANNTAADHGGGLRVLDQFGDGSADNAPFNSGSFNIGGNPGAGETYTLTIARSTFSGNSADNDGNTLTGAVPGNRGGGGAIFLDGRTRLTTLNLTNSTLSGNASNSVASQGADPQGGGAIFNRQGTANIVNTTIAENTTNRSGGSLLNDGGTYNIRNTIVAGGQAATGNEYAGTGTINSGGFNLVGLNGNAGGFPVTGQDFTLTGPVSNAVGPLADNGGPPAGASTDPNRGPTLTRLPVLLGEAFNRGNNALALDPGGQALPTDQRGVNRINNGTVEIGAVEVNYQLVGGSTQTTRVGTTFGQPLQVTLLENGRPVTTGPGGRLATGVPITFTLPDDSGPSATFANGSKTVTIVTDANGQATTPSVIANGQVGSYTPSIQVLGQDPASLGFTTPSFRLTNTDIATVPPPITTLPKPLPPIVNIPDPIESARIETSAGGEPSGAASDESAEDTDASAQGGGALICRELGDTDDVDAKQPFTEEVTVGLPTYSAAFSLRPFGQTNQGPNFEPRSVQVSKIYRSDLEGIPRCADELRDSQQQQTPTNP